MASHAAGDLQPWFMGHAHAQVVVTNRYKRVAERMDMMLLQWVRLDRLITAGLGGARHRGLARRRTFTWASRSRQARGLTGTMALL